MKEQKEKPEYRTQSTLLERGWSKGLIKKLLGDPDKLVPNPHYRSGPKMKLYEKTRIEEAEQSTVFLKFKTDAPRRRESAKTQKQQRRRALINLLASASVCPLAIYENVVTARWTPFNESDFPEAFCRDVPEMLWLALDPFPEYEQEAIEMITRIVLAALDLHAGRNRHNTPHFDQIERVFNIWRRNLDMRSAEGIEAFTYVFAEAIAPNGTKGLRLCDRRRFALDRLNEISARQWIPESSFFEQESGNLC